MCIAKDVRIQELRKQGYQYCSLFQFSDMHIVTSMLKTFMTNQLKLNRFLFDYLKKKKKSIFTNKCQV